MLTSASLGWVLKSAGRAIAFWTAVCSVLQKKYSEKARIKDVCLCYCLSCTSNFPCASQLASQSATHKPQRRVNSYVCLSLPACTSSRIASAPADYPCSFPAHLFLHGLYTSRNVKSGRRQTIEPVKILDHGQGWGGGRALDCAGVLMEFPEVSSLVMNLTHTHRRISGAAIMHGDGCKQGTALSAALSAARCRLCAWCLLPLNSFSELFVVSETAINIRSRLH